MHPVALLVEQERRHLDGQLRDDLGRAFLARFLADDAQYGQRERLDAANIAEARATRAGHMGRFADRRPQALARHLEQSESADLADLYTRAILAHGFPQAILDGALVLGRTHVDEVDDDETAQVANAQLARNFVGGLEVGVQRRGLDVSALRGAGRVDIDRDERFRVVDHDAAARRQADRVREG